MFVNPGSRVRLSNTPGKFNIEPWVVSGQTTINHNVSSDNPAPSSNGLTGEVTALPYTVPPGKVLLITGMYMEGNTSASNTSTNDVHTSGVQAIWIGASVVSNSQFIISNQCLGDSNAVTGLKFYIPAGKIVNVRITSTNAVTDGWVTGWAVFGYLLSPNAVPLIGI